MKRPTLAHAYATLDAFDVVERLAPCMVPCMPAIAVTHDMGLNNEPGLVFIELTDGSALEIVGPDVTTYVSAEAYKQARGFARRYSCVRT